MLGFFISNSQLGESDRLEAILEWRRKLERIGMD